MSYDECSCSNACRPLFALSDPRERFRFLWEPKNPAKAVIWQISEGKLGSARKPKDLFEPIARQMNAVRHAQPDKRKTAQAFLVGYYHTVAYLHSITRKWIDSARILRSESFQENDPASMLKLLKALRGEMEEFEGQQSSAFKSILWRWLPQMERDAQAFAELAASATHRGVPTDIASGGNCNNDDGTPWKTLADYVETLNK